MRRHWWINHEGDRDDPVHVEVADGRHWLGCHNCGTRVRIPAPRDPLWSAHPGYQQPRSTYRADLNVIVTTGGAA